MASLSPDRGKLRSNSTIIDENAPGEPTADVADQVGNGSAESSNKAASRKEYNTIKDQETAHKTAESDPSSDDAPPLPAEPTPGAQEEEADDGWAPVWEASAQAFYFYNRFTGASQWTNPRVPDLPAATAPGVDPTKPDAADSLTSPPPPTEGSLPAGGYNPAIHGDYDPNAWYAQSSVPDEPEVTKVGIVDPNSQYAATAAFNRFTGRFQNSEINPENFNDENKSKRQMNAFFDVDAAANSHDGRSLKAERSGKKLTKSELKQFKEKRKARKEEKRRAWLKD